MRDAGRRVPLVRAPAIVRGLAHARRRSGPPPVLHAQSNQRRERGARSRSRGHTARVTRSPTTGRRSSATRSSSTACSTARRRGRSSFALDAATGTRAVGVQPVCAAAGAAHSLGVNRGVVFWAGGDDRRIFVATGPRLYAIDARTGKPIPSFGANGSVALLEGLGRDVSRLYVLSNTPGAIYKDVLIVGTPRVGGPRPLGAGAHPRLRRAHRARSAGPSTRSRTRASSVTTPGRRTPGHGWAAPMPGAGISVDTARGLVFLPRARPRSISGAAIVTAPTCSPTPCSRSRRTRASACGTTSSSITTSGIATCPPPPCWSRCSADGRRVDAVAQITKSSHVFLFDRETGTPLFPIEEQPVPPSDLEGRSRMADAAASARAAAVLAPAASRKPT